jgi:cytosine/adenosine deaminase-related metal-dependent hydrolase
LLVAHDDLVLDGGLLLVCGRVERVLRSSAAVRRAGAHRRHELDGVVTPGLVDAHAHLELGGLDRELPARDGFTAWVGALLAARATRSPAELGAGAARDAARLLATGTTTVGDVDSTGAGLAAALARAGAGPATVLYREVLDGWDPARTAAALAGVRRALPRRARLAEGLSPHAPFTVSPPLQRALAALARRRRLPIAVHWSESEDERRWLERDAGPLTRVLPAGPRRAGLDVLQAAGLLGPRTALIHGNLPRRGEPARIARAGATLVHCPGTHAFFGRGRFPVERYLRAGVTLALGTDSRASNADLDMRREMALFRASSGLSPARVFAAATTGGARALGMAGEIGTLERGRRADLVAFDARASGLRGLLDELTAGRPDVLAVAVAGRVAGNAAEAPPGSA